ncbi:MAG: hypothetical protein D6715_04725, partial [Calditrichaeota bacterium]
RFKIEAQAAAALNHPNIATIYAIEEHEDELFIVMEYIEGKELRHIVGVQHAAPLPSAHQILDTAMQIAEGLQAAHAKGIVHRDIKSSNIMVTGDGQVKIMDFGLAKIVGGAQLTKDHSTLGTAAYMSPEQARGEPVDQRTDIWSFGVVLYEMLTGELPFKGDYEQAVIYSILNEAPDFSGIPEDFLPVVQKALAKQAEARYQTVEDVLADLKTLSGLETQSAGGIPVELQSPGTAKTSVGAKPAPIKKSPLLIGGLVVFLLLAAAIGYFFFGGGPAPLRIVSTRPLTSAPGFEGQPTWSPDGTRIAYSSDESGRRDIWVRQLRAGQSINLTKDHPGSQNTAPAWSPDGEWIAFASDREQTTGLFAIPASGGNARRILAVGETGIDAVCWSPDASKLAFVTSKLSLGANAIYTVSAQGGEKTELPFAIKGLSVQDPAWSPDGRRLAIVEVMGTGISTSKLWTLKLDGRDLWPLTDATSFDRKPLWSADGKRIVFVSDRGGSSDIWWLPLDANGGAAGPAKALTTGVGVGAIALSVDGKKLAYEKIVQTSSIWSMPMSKEGLLTLKDAKLISAENNLIENAAISPDGKWLAFDSNRAGNVDIWIMKTDGSDQRQVTTDPSHDWWPTWSPDSKRIAFHSLRSGNRDIWVKPVAGGAAKQLTSDPGKDWLANWSSNSEEIAFTSFHNGSANIWIVSQSSGPRQLTFQKSKNAFPGAWDPEGSRLAFSSLQTGKEELYLVSSKGGQTEQLTESNFQTINPFAWSRDGETIYVLAVRESANTGNIYAVSTTDGAIKKITNFADDPSKYLAWVTSDGQRFYLVFNHQKSDIWVAELAEEQ